MTSIPELFRLQAKRSPGGIAVAINDATMTYAELDRRSDGVARRLRALGVGPDVRVAIYLERSIDLVVAMLGVLKAGGAYVPLDPLHPPQRLAYILGDAQPAALLTSARLQSEAPGDEARVVLVDGAAAPPRPEIGLDEMQGPSPNHLAYVIYTSGSTGAPKGVEIEHRAVANLLESMRRRPGLRAEDIWLAITTPTFDISVLEIFLPLVCGARVVIAPGETVSDGAALGGLIERSGATVFQATPSTMRMLLDAGWTGSPGLKLLCGGEAWSEELAERLLPCCGSLWNMYGPTETTVWSAVAKVEAGQAVVLGPPIANTSLYVLDDARQPAPPGVAGELFIGGDGLARGYFNRPELTSERFVADPFAASADARMYRTGDLVRRRRDGALEFLGRLDHQVKVRGHRVELGEIEAALQRYPSVERCLVVAREDGHGDQQLVAYVIAAAGREIVPSELRAALGKTLPSYMIPARYVPLASFPLTPNGKLDRKALPSPSASLERSDPASGLPRSPTETALAQIWREMLEREHVGIYDDFFDLGGHSLLATRVISRINQSLKVRLPVPTFFQNPTIEQLARLLDQQHPVRPEPRLVQLQQGTTGPPVYFFGAGPAEIQVARLMGEDRPIYAVDIPIPVEWGQTLEAGSLGEAPTIEQLGDLPTDLILAHTGSSPCVVAGYSMWGRIAFEAARALQGGGGNVAFVLLLDASVDSQSETFWGAGAESFRWIWGHGSTEASGAGAKAGLVKSLGRSVLLLKWLLARTPQMVRILKRPRTYPSGYLHSDGSSVRLTLMDRINRFIGRTYRPIALDAKGVLIRAQFPGDKYLPGYDFTNGWRGLFNLGLEIVEAVGDHHSMLREANLERAAKLINGVLDRDDLSERVRRFDTPGRAPTADMPLISARTPPDPRS